MLCIYLNNNPESKIFNGKGIILGGSKQINSNFIEGDLSAILLENFPFWVNTHRLPDIKTATMKNWDEKIKRITDQSINKNITRKMLNKITDKIKESVLILIFILVIFF